MALELIAPAKVNLTLEILGKRPDGYHEIASVMQTIDLADLVRLEHANEIALQVMGPAASGLPEDVSRNLAYRAALALRLEAGRPELGVRITLEKRIPAGMGLGGGSTDAAAVLRGLDRLWTLHMGAERLSRIAASLGSDVPFFLQGGTALSTGRGETLSTLPDVSPVELVLFIADIEVEDKTRRMYTEISPLDYTDGFRTRELAERLRRGAVLDELDLRNVFDSHVGALARTIVRAMTMCLDGGLTVITAGSGPAFFGLACRDELPERLLSDIERDCGVHAIAARTLTRAESLAMVEV